jgi:hypothetical protein
LYTKECAYAKERNDTAVTDCPELSLCKETNLALYRDVGESFKAEI